jgi:hypothetical protein
VIGEVMLVKPMLMVVYNHYLIWLGMNLPTKPLAPVFYQNYYLLV